VTSAVTDTPAFSLVTRSVPLSKSLVPPQPPSPGQIFSQFAKMSPADLIRTTLLMSMGITEDDLKTLPPAKQKEIEQMIEDLIKQAAQKHTGGAFFADIQPDKLLLHT
jgi:hypothetical protein